MKKSNSLPFYLTLVLTVILVALLMGCAPGRNGRNGIDGAPGVGCNVELVGPSPATPNGGSIVRCENTATLIRNGTDGRDAEPSAFNIASIVDPCGKQTAYDEVLLVLQNGTVLAHYSDGAKQFLTQLTPGAYITTDGTACRFTLNANGLVQ